MKGIIHQGHGSSLEVETTEKETYSIGDPLSQRQNAHNIGSSDIHTNSRG